jgi:uncharacterized membrane-anchored protein
MILGLMIGMFILGMILLCVGAAVEYSNNTACVVLIILAVLLMLGSCVMFIFRMFSWIYKSSKDRRYTPRSYNCC